MALFFIIVRDPAKPLTTSRQAPFGIANEKVINS